MQKSYQIVISGQVQGVGFRPYVYGLAHQYHLRGTVSNNEEGVLILIYGEEKACSDFYKHILESPPPVSKIDSHAIMEIDPHEFTNFSIVPSQTQGSINLRLTPDFAICDQCRKDMKSPENRRFEYPFTTCIHCGPRWAITKKFPFDRENTRMSTYTMCDSCKEEYTNPADRRFHSQTNSCPSCGIQLSLWNAKKNLISQDASIIFKEIAQRLREGKIIALKNTSGFLLCCHAEHTEVVQKLRQLKKRPQKPFAVLFPSLEKLQSELPLNEAQIAAFTSSERPIVILPLQNYSGKIALDAIAPGLSQLGVMLPYTGMLQLLAEEIDFPIVATSGNLHGSPIISDSEVAFEKLKKVADYFVLHDLVIEHPQDDSVLKFSFQNQIPILFRRSRGYAPNIFSPSKVVDEPIMAMGADLKSAIAFLPNEHLYMSQYLGNLENYDVYERFTRETQAFLELFGESPKTVLIDKHPKYFSAAYGLELANSLSSDVVPVQHHKAHFASVLGEHSLFNRKEKILGVVWDGVGYGDDQQIWGGEFFDYYEGFIKRIGHFEYFDWLAGDKMSKEPRLSLFSLVEDSSFIASKFTQEERSIYSKLKQKNQLKTSSVGRLFDAVASLLGICDINTYEGEASILLENSIDGYDLTECHSYLPPHIDSLIPTRAIISGILNDLNKGVSVERIVQNFIYSLALLVYRFAEKKGYRSICCSGGVFQNTTLVDMLHDLKTDSYELYFNKELSPNDENISYGQTQYFLNCHTS